MLRRDEGVRYSPYLCPAGRLTIGVGHNLDDVPISDKAVDVILDDDIESHTAAAIRLIGENTWQNLSENRKLALLNLAFNLGEAGLAKFVNTLAAIRRGDWAETAKNLRQSKWYNQVGGRAERVISMLADDTFPY